MDASAGQVSFPAVGERVSSGWRLEAMSCGADTIRFRLKDDRARVVTLALSADPAVGAKSPFAPLYYERTEVAVDEFAAAARHVLGAIQQVTPSAAGAFEALKDVALAHGARLQAEPRSLPRDGASATAPVVDWTLRLVDATIEWSADGVTGERVTFRGERSPSAASVAAIVAELRARRASRVVVEAPAPDDSPEPRRLPLIGESRIPSNWRAELLIALGAAAGEGGAPLRFRFPITERALVEIAALAPLAASLLEGAHRGLELALEVPDVDENNASDGPVPLSTLVHLPAGVEQFIRERGLERSGVGQPRCVVNRHLWSSTHGSDIVGTAVFAPACDECVLRGQCSGVSAAYAKHVGLGELSPLRSTSGGPIARTVDEVPWQDKVRWLLTDRPRLGMRLADVYPGQLPEVRCVRPWTYFETHEYGTYGPCCSDYMSIKGRMLPRDANLGEVWSERGLFGAFRRALLHEEHPSTCRDVCPVMVGGLHRLADFTLQGGGAAAVENQIRAATAMIEGRDRIDALPTSLNIATTSYCNYDCLMCNCGKVGTLDDEKTAGFYEQVEAWFDNLVIIDANGGEPLASPNYRAFVERVAASSRESNLQLTTNGSLLTPRWLASLPRLPFRTITISLNAASAETYLAVNRGVTWETVRRNIQELLRLRDTGRWPGLLRYSMVVLRRNIDEIRALAELAVEDDAEVRFMLPMRDLDGQTIMTSREAMERAMSALSDVKALAEKHGMRQSARDAAGKILVLRKRLDADILAPM